ncbi:hypothetical protein DSO57_1012020 [Entomophthora muscae]|uniref:Uncharacterized protein n=1 Tax=Entomophthora muscae TaxID=34485 RepID=A0ACC2URG4_9FUNG|nr:hypothetical protein DSO57_1012020 [Entomophthora muscae]
MPQNPGVFPAESEVETGYISRALMVGFNHHVEPQCILWKFYNPAFEAGWVVNHQLYMDLGVVPHHTPAASYYPLISFTPTTKLTFFIKAIQNAAKHNYKASEIKQQLELMATAYLEGARMKKGKRGRRKLAYMVSTFNL